MGQIGERGPDTSLSSLSSGFHSNRSQPGDELVGFCDIPECIKLSEGHHKIIKLCALLCFLLVGLSERFDNDDKMSVWFLRSQTFQVQPVEMIFALNSDMRKV